MVGHGASLDLLKTRLICCPLSRIEPWIMHSVEVPILQLMYFNCVSYILSNEMGGRPWMDRYRSEQSRCTWRCCQDPTRKWQMFCFYISTVSGTCRRRLRSDIATDLPCERRHDVGGLADRTAGEDLQLAGWTVPATSLLRLCDVAQVCKQLWLAATLCVVRVVDRLLRFQYRTSN